MKKAIIIAAVLIFTVTVVGCAQRPVEEEVPEIVTVTVTPTATPTETPTPTSTPTPTPTSTPVSDEVTFRDTALGFTLTMPAAWENYRTELHYPESRTGTFTYNTVSFSLEGEDIFSISAYTKPQWEELLAAGMNPTKLGENATYVFSYESASGLVNPDRYGEIPEIVDTFRVL
ncbi:hypothetical protein ACFL2B_00725 [Patescibacteria group bacterium]